MLASLQVVARILTAAGSFLLLLALTQLFVLNTFLDVLENEGGQCRKYIVAASHGSEVFVLNLEEKFRRDLLDLDLNAPEE